jgi:hypothetical protein
MPIIKQENLESQMRKEIKSILLSKDTMQQNGQDGNFIQVLYYY